MTSVAPANVPPQNNPAVTARRRRESPAEAEFALVAVTGAMLHDSLIQVKPSEGRKSPAGADPAPSDAQPAASGAAETSASAVVAAERKLAERRSAERPNQVDLARRATAELSAPRDPLGLIPTTEAPRTNPGDASHPGRSAQDSPTDGGAPKADHAISQPGPALTAADAGPAIPAGKPVTNQPSNQHSAGPEQRLQVISGAVATPVPPSQRESARVAAPATAVGAASKAAAAVTRVEHTGQGPAPMRDRLWRHLERLGQRPARAQEAHLPGSRLDDADAQPARFEAQLARGLAAALKQREGHVTLRLTPETLGKLRIDLNIADDRVTAHIAASSEQARRLLKENVVSLRTALEATGLGVDRIEVVGAPAEPATQPPPANAPAAGDPAPSMAWNGGAGEGGGHAPDGREQARHGTATGPSDGDAGASGTAEMELSEYGYVLRVDFLA